MNRQVLCAPLPLGPSEHRDDRILSRRKRKSVEVLGDIITVIHQSVGVLAFRLHMGKLRDCRSGAGNGRPEH